MSAPHNRGDLLAEAVLSTKVLLARYLVGFDDTNAVRQAPALPNHVAWNLGHLALTLHRVAGMLDGRGTPASEISDAPDAVRAGAFHSESVAFGSAPAADAAKYPSLARSIEIYNNACDRVAAAARTADDAALDREVPWGAGTTPLWSLVIRMVFHNGFHTGQIADLRRAFGFESIFG